MARFLSELVSGSWALKILQQLKSRSSPQSSGQRPPSSVSTSIQEPRLKKSRKAVVGVNIGNQTTTRDVDKIIIHCSDTYPDMDIGVEEIREWHVNERKWSDIGYHFVIRRDGTIETGRDLDKDGDVFEEVGAHTFGHNLNSIGICMVGGKSPDNKPSNNFTKEQFTSLRNLIRIIRDDYYKATVHGHRDFSSYKTCPNFDVDEWLERERVI